MRWSAWHCCACVSGSRTGARTTPVSRPTSSGVARDQGWFMGVFVFKVGLGLLAFAWKPWLGLLFLLAYALYVKRELSAEDTCSEADVLEPLKFRPRDADAHDGLGLPAGPCWPWW